MRKKPRNNKRHFNQGVSVTVAVIVLAVVAGASYVLLPSLNGVDYDSGNDPTIVDHLAESVEANTVEEPKDLIKYVETPESVKAIYMTACVAGTPSFRQDLVDLVEETEINSIIIDIKDFTGTISFDSDNPKLLGQNGDGCRVDDMKEFIATLHEKGIYVIGRITVFQDPYYSQIRPDLAVKRASDGAVWQDYKGISFIEVGAREYWDYIVEISKESRAIGFDELNFDYIRFPSDGNMRDIYFPFSEPKIVADPENGKSEALREFFVYLSEEMDKIDVTTSADLFGMVTTNKDDLEIGQILEKALPYFDYIAPMVYPSHYPNNFNGWSDPDDYPYELIHYVMGAAVDRVESFKTATTTPEIVRSKISTDQLRPWIQDFDYGGNYGPVEVREQIQATYDVGLDSWMLWAPSNRYTKAALENES